MAAPTQMATSRHMHLLTELSDVYLVGSPKNRIQIYPGFQTQLPIYHKYNRQKGHVSTMEMESAESKTAVNSTGQ